MPQVKIQAVPALVRHTLLHNTDVHAIVGANVRTSHVLDNEQAQGIDYPCVILSTEGGESTGTGAVQYVSVEIFAYSRTSKDDAGALYDAIYAALHYTRLSNPHESGAGFARESTRPKSGWNDKALAYYCAGRWLITLSA